MAAKKERIMVRHEEGATAPIALPSATSPPDLFGVLNTGQASAVVANEEANIPATSTPGSAMGTGQMVSTLNSAARSNNQPENLPPESTYSGIKVMLDNNNMWNEFFKCKTEMIITKQGRRMFPYCRFRVSGLEPLQKYTLLMDINPVDNKRYKWTGQDWQMSGKAEAHLLRRVFIHPDSPSSGHQWMQNPVSFYKLKLTDNTMDQEGNVILHPMHRYLPHLHLVSAETATEDIQLNGPDVITFTFPQTEFFAVTAYQNVRMSRFKADFNPFASGPNSQALKLKMSPSNELKDDTRSPNELKTVKGLNGLKSLMAAKRRSKDTSTVDKGLLSPDAQNVSLADGDKTEVKTDGPSSRLKSRPSNEMNKDSAQSPNELKSVKSLNNLNQKTSLSSSVSSEAKMTGFDEQLQGKAKPHKRPEPVPLPLLALYLQQLKLKSRSVRTKPKSPPGLPSSSSPSSAVPTTDPVIPATDQTGPVMDSSGPALESTGPALESTALSSTPSLANLEPEFTPSLPSPGPLRGALERLLPPNPFVLSSEFSSHGSLLGLPAPDPFLTIPFIPLLPSAHINPLPFEATSFSSTPHPDSLALDTALSPSDTTSSFQVNYEPLTHPSTPSPLPFQLSSFSLLGPDPLSPTPSLITEDIPSSEAPPVPCPPVRSTPSIPVSSTLPVGSSQPTQRNKPWRSKKIFRKGVKSAKGDSLPVIDGSTDVAMQPNLEEVEEQLFVSFTSKFNYLSLSVGGLETTEERIVAFEKVILGDLKVMRHRQVIHPVLQEVGLKMSLLDPTLVIDLQYLGVRLPLPPPFLCGSVPFVSRTGKTTDFTQIKGWRDKFVPSNSPSSSKPEGCPSSEVVPKNLSAFCSDMLDEYLANEGKLIDERAASFTQTTVVTPVVYQLPTKSTSYVRTLDSVLKKQAPALSSTFVPPSKKPRLPPTSKQLKKSEKRQQKQQCLKQNRTKLTSATTPTSLPTEPKLLLMDHEPQPAAKTKVVFPGLTKALLRQRDLQDLVVWEGKRRTCISNERATIALTSHFTSTVRSNPTAPIRIIKRRAPPCLKAFCRLGCVCASLAQDRRIIHCGKIECIFGCSCLRQKVVVLKNLEGPDSNASEEGLSKKRRRKWKRMRMAYSEEAEMVSEPAPRVRMLWRKTDGETDPEPVLAPTPVYLPHLPLQEEPSVVSRKRVSIYPYVLDIPLMSEKSLSCHRPKYKEPSKRLEIMSKCKWSSLADRNLVLRIVCEHMAKDHLRNPFWVKGYLIKPVSQTLRNDGESCSIHYKVLISQVPRPDEVEEENGEEEEEWMGEEDEEELMEEQREEDKVEEVPGLPFLTGISPAGLLTGNLKLPEISDQKCITVNGMSYPHAKIQLGMMGAMHPANRLAAYLTGKLRRPACLKRSMAASSVPSQKHPSETPKGATDTKSSTRQPAQLAAIPTTMVTTSVPSTIPVAAGPKFIGENHSLYFMVMPMFSIINEKSPTLFTGANISPQNASRISEVVTSPPMLSVPGTSTSVRMPSPLTSLTPIMSLTPLASGQRIVLQPVRNTSANTLYKNPKGQLIQLVALSQLKALNPKLVMHNKGECLTVDYIHAKALLLFHMHDLLCVASVTIIIPSMSKPISLTPTFNNCNGGVPHSADVISLVKARQNQSAPGVSGGAQRRPAPVKGRGSGLEYGEVLGKQLDHAVDGVGINDADGNSEEDEDNKDGDGEDESLASVLNEIFILHQVPTPQTDRVLLPPKTEKAIIGDGDDECSLSPGLPIPQAEDLKVGFGSNLKPSETVSAPAVNGHSQQAKACTTKGQDVLQKALTPPLLLQMKVGGVAEVLESNEKPGDALTPPPLLQMRPMPRLDPR
uniref:MAX gene-associated protein n=1 Tax=Oncorhynchus kisutch TaxID=8019 RepID=A0A8C7LF79_ONCKI